jgi:hypothetical protein
MKLLRTAGDRFSHLAEYPFEPNYTEGSDGEGGLKYFRNPFPVIQPVTEKDPDLNTALRNVHS